MLGQQVCIRIIISGKTHRSRQQVIPIKIITTSWRMQMCLEHELQHNDISTSFEMYYFV